MYLQMMVQERTPINLLHLAICDTFKRFEIDIRDA